MHIVAVGGSDAGISAGLRARELDPGEVPRWQNLAHRTTAELEAAGLMLRLDTTARRIDVADRKLLVTGTGGEEVIGYDRLVIGTGALPVRPPITGLDVLGPADGVHLPAAPARAQSCCPRACSRFDWWARSQGTSGPRRASTGSSPRRSASM